MSNQKLKSKIYALIIAVTLFVSVNKVTQAEEKSRITETKELADNGKIVQPIKWKRKKTTKTKFQMLIRFNILLKR